MPTGRTHPCEDHHLISHRALLKGKRPEYPTFNFKGLAEETGIPYQQLINLYLRDCLAFKTKPTLSWAS